MGSHQAFHSHPSRTQSFSSPLPTRLLRCFPWECMGRTHSWGMDGWNGTNVKTECCERRVGEQLQASLFVCPSLDVTVLPGDWAHCLVLAL